MDTLLMIIIGVLGFWILTKIFWGSNSKDDREEDFAEEDSNEEDEDENPCDICERNITEDEETYECDECGNDNICRDCMCDFTDINLCKSCLKKECPQNVETKIEYKDRIIEKVVYVDKEGVPLDIKFDPFAKTEFD